MSRIILAQADVEVGAEPVTPGEVLDLGINPVTGETPGEPPAANSTHGAGDDPNAAATDPHAPAGPHDAAETHGEMVGAADHGPGAGTFPAFDATMFASHLFWLAIAFGVLYLVVKRVVMPRVGGIVEDRNSRIANDVGEATRLSRETDEMVSAYETELSEARHRAYGIAQARRDELKAEQARRQAETEAALANRILQAEVEIGRRRDAALADVDAIAAEATKAIVSRLAGVSASDDEDREAVVRTEVSRA